MTMRKLGLILLAVNTIAAVVVMSEVAFPQTVDKTNRTSEIIAIYDSLESELLNRLERQLRNHDTELAETVMALAHIGSKKAVPIFLANITVVPSTPIKKIGGFYPIKTVKNSSYDNIYVMLVALIRLKTISLDQCMAEIAKAPEKSLRETLLVSLGQETHGKTFINEIKSRALIVNQSERWRRLSSMLTKEKQE